jgi:hypothetical protein
MVLKNNLAPYNEIKILLINTIIQNKINKNHSFLDSCINLFYLDNIMSNILEKGKILSILSIFKESVVNNCKSRKKWTQQPP